MSWALQSPSCWLTRNFTLSVRRVFVKTACMNIFFRSKQFYVINRSRFVVNIKDCIQKLGSGLCFSSVILVIPLFFILKFRKKTGISFNTTHVIFNWIMWWEYICRGNGSLLCCVSNGLHDMRNVSKSYLVTFIQFLSGKEL